MKREHDDDEYDDGGDNKRRRGDGPKVEFRFLLASKVSMPNLLECTLPNCSFAQSQAGQLSNDLFSSNIFILSGEKVSCWVGFKWDFHIA